MLPVELVLLTCLCISGWLVDLFEWVALAGPYSTNGGGMPKGSVGGAPSIVDLGFWNREGTLFWVLGSMVGLPLDPFGFVVRGSDSETFGVLLVPILLFRLEGLKASLLALVVASGLVPNTETPILA